MCGRFVITPPAAALARIFAAAVANDLPLTPNFNVCPAAAIITVTSTAGRRRLRSMRWGFLPHWAKSPADGPLLINARAETIAGKPAFRAAVRARRCLIPATGFYEWTKTPEGLRLPWYVHPAAGGLLAFGGIWQDWEHGGRQLTTCAIVTTAASKEMKPIHERMPLILAPDSWPLWLGEAGPGVAVLLRHPAPEGRLAAYRVDPAVNSSRASGPALIRQAV